MTDLSTGQLVGLVVAIVLAIGIGASLFEGRDQTERTEWQKQRAEQWMELLIGIPFGIIVFLFLLSAFFFD